MHKLDLCHSVLFTLMCSLNAVESWKLHSVHNTPPNQNLYSNVLCLSNIWRDVRFWFSFLYNCYFSSNGECDDVHHRALRHINFPTDRTWNIYEGNAATTFVVHFLSIISVFLNVKNCCCHRSLPLHSKAHSKIYDWDFDFLIKFKAVRVKAPCLKKQVVWGGLLTLTLKSSLISCDVLVKCLIPQKHISYFIPPVVCVGSRHVPPLRWD